MSTSSTRRIELGFTGDVATQATVAAATNTLSPAITNLVSLASGANTITPPTGGSSPKALTIIPPSGNVVTITLKGVTGDTGILLHPTDPTTIALGSTTNTLTITTSAILTGLRLIWS